MERWPVKESVDADVIARGLSAFDPESVAIAAGRVMLARLRELAERRKNVAFETTLASRSFGPWLSGLRESDYEVHFLFLDGHVVEEALRQGVREAMIRHRKDGLPVAIYRDGKTVWVNPEELGY